MCGIFGVIASSESEYNLKLLNDLTIKLALLFESLGKDSSGFI